MRESARPLYADGLDMVVSGQVQRAFDVAQEPAKLRDAYGRDSIGEKALLARRLVEAGVTFVLVSGAWGYFDHHGDEVKWGGIEKGSRRYCRRVDRVMHTLVTDLADRGLLDSTLVLMMGEFGRSPVMTKTAGRGHWTNVMSMLVAGGGLPSGQVIGGTDEQRLRRSAWPGHAGRSGGHDLSSSRHRPRKPMGQSARPADSHRHRRRPPNSRVELKLAASPAHSVYCQPAMISKPLRTKFSTGSGTEFSISVITYVSRCGVKR